MAPTEFLRGLDAGLLPVRRPCYRRRMPSLARRLRTLPWPALTTLCVACALTTSPGLGVLDYHASLFLALVVGLAGGWVVLAGTRKSLRRLAFELAAVVVLPLFALLVAGVWVPNCNLLQGLAFYALGPVCSALIGAAWAAASLQAWPTAADGSSRVGRATATFAALVLLSLVRPLLHFYTQPQVQAWHGLVGWLAGALYEDAVAVGTPYVVWRIVGLATWGPLLVLFVALRSVDAPYGLRAVGTLLRRSRAAQVGALSVVLGLLAGEWLAEPMGWRLPAAAVEQVLSVRLEIRMPGVRLQDPAAAVVHLSPQDADGPDGLALQRAVTADVAFRHHQLHQWFGVTPPTVQVYLYEDAEQKRRWMGAEHVDMAKPWLAQVHLTLPEYGASVLAHELAHVFAGVLAPLPFRVPLRGGVLPDALLIEGTAVAAEWPQTDGMDPHRSSRAMRMLGLAPPLRELFSPVGFFGQSSGRAYTLAGSFLRWLRDRYGPQVFAQIYRTADLTQATGVAVDQLVAEWERFVDDAAAHPVSPDELDRARARFERPGLFGQACALEVGRSVRRATDLWRDNDLQGSQEVWGRLLDRLGTVCTPEPGLQLGLAAAQGRIGRFPEALRLAQAVLDLPDAVTATQGLNRLERAEALVVHGDLSLGAGNLQRAQADWHAALALPVHRAARRALEVRLLLASTLPGREAIRDLLGAHGPYRKPGPVVDRLHAALPDSPVATYLWARYHLLRGELTQAPRTLQATLPALQACCTELPQETVRLVALAAAREGRCAELDVWLRAQSAVLDARPVWADELRQRCLFASSPTTR